MRSFVGFRAGFERLLSELFFVLFSNLYFGFLACFQAAQLPNLGFLVFCQAPSKPANDQFGIWERRARGPPNWRFGLLRGLGKGGKIQNSNL